MSVPTSILPDFGSKIRGAYDLIRADIRRTPVEYSKTLSDLTGSRVFFKWECDQFTGSFKLRGALHKLRVLSREERARGVVSASTGNHGLAISHASRLEGVELKLFLPTTVSDIKRKKIESLGVGIEYFGESCEKTEARARQEAESSGRVFVSPYNDWDIIFGAGTLGLEIADDVPNADDILVPVGGGGLIAGVAGCLRALRPAVRTMGVEPETSAFMAASLEAGRLVDVEESETIADAVAGGIEPGAITFPLCRDLVERIVTVPEALIARAMAIVFESHRRVVEGAGALPVAALLGSPALFRGRRVVAVVSGGNIAPDRFRAVTGLDVSL